MSSKQSAHTILFSDFDGTLVDTKTFRVSKKLTKLLYERQRDLALVVVTSRGWDGLAPYGKDLNLYLPQILENGSRIIDPCTEKVLYKKVFSKQAKKELAKLAREKNIPVSFSTSFASFDDPRLLEKTADVGRISFCNNTSVIDMAPSGVSKRTGVEQWFRLVKPNEQRIFVAGDRASDKELFQLKIKGVTIRKVAMENGSDVLKKHADVIVPAASEDGMYHFLLKELAK